VSGAAIRPELLVLGAGGWHWQQLARAAERLRLPLRRLGFAALHFDGTARFGLRLGGSEELPGAVLVRFVPGGSFEQVTRRLGLLHALETLGVPVINSARAIERCVDKSATSFVLQRAGLPTPPAWTVERLDEARAIVEAPAARSGGSPERGRKRRRLVPTTLRTARGWRSGLSGARDRW